MNRIKTTLFIWGLLFLTACADQAQTPAVTGTTQATAGKIYYGEDYNRLMNDSLPLMIDFNAKWCGPCKLMKPIFEELSAEYKGKVNFISIDTDKFPEIAEIYRISSIPTFILVEKKNIKWGNEGSLPKTMLEEPLKAYK